MGKITSHSITIAYSKRHPLQTMYKLAKIKIINYNFWVINQQITGRPSPTDKTSWEAETSLRENEATSTQGRPAPTDKTTVASYMSSYLRQNIDGPKFSSDDVVKLGGAPPHKDLWHSWTLCRKCGGERNKQLKMQGLPDQPLHQQLHDADLPSISG